MSDVKGYLATLKYAATAGGYSGANAIARIKSIKPPKITAKDIDTTCLDSADEFEESIAGLASAGEIEANVHYDKTATATLYGQFRVQQYFWIVYADGSGWKQPGYIAEIGDEEVVNGDIVRTTLKIKVTGKPTKMVDVANGS